MTIDDSVRWMHTPPIAAKPRPAESIWKLTKGARSLICELRYPGEYGVETLVLLDGELHIGRRFPTRALALEEAILIRLNCLERDWRPVGSNQEP